MTEIPMKMWQISGKESVGKLPMQLSEQGFLVIKGTKQCCELESDIDFQEAKDAYTTTKGQVKDL